MRNGNVPTKTKDAPATWQPIAQNVGRDKHGGRSGRIWGRVRPPDGGLHHARGRIRRRSARVRPVRTRIPTSDVAAARMRDARLPRGKGRMAPRARLRRSSEAQTATGAAGRRPPKHRIGRVTSVPAEAIRHLDRRGPARERTSRQGCGAKERRERDCEWHAVASSPQGVSLAQWSPRDLPDSP